MSSRPKPPVVTGFDAVAAILSTTFYDCLPGSEKLTKGTAIGHVNTAQRHLKSSFAKSVKPCKKTNSPVPDPLAHQTSARTTNVATRSSVDSGPSSRVDSTVKSFLFPGDGASDECSNPDEQRLRVTTTFRGLRRLKYHEVLRLRPGDRFTCVVPPILDYKVSADTRKHRVEAMALFRRIIIRSVRRTRR